MRIEIGEQTGRSYCLDLHSGSVNYIRPIMRSIDSMPIPDYNYGYYFAGPHHFTYRDIECGLYQVFITHNGRGRFIVEGKEHFMGPNAVAFLDLSKPHRYETVGESWEYEWVNFSGRVCGYYYPKINPDGFTVYDMIGSETIKEIMSDIRRLITMGVSEELYAQTSTRILTLLDALVGLTSRYMLQKQPEHYHDNIRIAIQYMNEHYMDNISLDALSEAAYLSKYYFTRSFSHYTGMTPYKYLTAIRLTYARQLLLYSMDSIEEISWKTGFKNSKNLIRAFKQATGTTPQRYRNDPQ